MLENFANHMRPYKAGLVDGEYYVLADSDLLIEPYQGRTYVKHVDYVRGRRIVIEDFVEYISDGYECYVGDPKLLETKDPVLYNYFVRRGLR